MTDTIPPRPWAARCKRRPDCFSVLARRNAGAAGHAVTTSRRGSASLGAAVEIPHDWRAPKHWLIPPSTLRSQKSRRPTPAPSIFCRMARAPGVYIGK